MVFLADPKFDLRWKSLNIKYLRKMFEPTNILMIVTDSSEEDVEAVKNSLEMYPRVKRNLVIFLIANMQDKANVLSVEKIKLITGIQDIIGISAISPNTKQLLEPFFEEAIKRYFLMLSKQGLEMEFLDPKEFAQEKPSINLNGTTNSIVIEQPKPTRFELYKQRLKTKTENSLQLNQNKNNEKK
jgi:hypothetical protein